MSVEFPEWVSLLGFYPEIESLNIIQGQGIEISEERMNALKSELSEARANVSGMQGRNNVVPQIKDITATHQNHVQKLQQHPTFNELVMGMNRWYLGLVELEKIHTVQPYINLEYIEQLKERVPEPENLEQTLEFCLPTNIPSEKVMVVFNPTQNTFSIVSENLNFRIIGNIQGEEPTTKRKFAGFMHGFGLPQMSVVSYQGITLLKNGYHRAYALMKKGHKFMPCMVLETNNLTLTGANVPGLLPLDVVLSDKSPIMSDYFSKAAVRVPRRRMRVVVSIHADTQIIPT